MSLTLGSPSFASATVAGLVSVAAQSFAGLKTFNDGIEASQFSGLGGTTPVLASAGGVGASDVGAKVGSTFSGTFAAGSRLLSVRKAIGGTEVERFGVSAVALLGDPTVKIASPSGNNVLGLLLTGGGVGWGGIHYNSDAGGRLVFGSYNKMHSVESENRPLFFSQNSNAYDTSALMQWQVYGATGVAASIPVFDFLAPSNIQSGQASFRVRVGGVSHAELTNAGKLKIYGDLEVSGFPNSRISCDGSRVDIGNGGSIPARALYMVGSAAAPSTAFYASGNGGFSAPNNARMWSETKGGTAGDNCVVSGTYINTALDAGARLHGFGKNLSSNTPTLYSAIMGNGEFEHFVAGAGIVLQSPNGTRWRLTVTNAGALSIAAA